MVKIEVVLGMARVFGFPEDKGESDPKTRKEKSILVASLRLEKLKGDST